MRWRWPWRRVVDTSDEACGYLRRLEQHDPEVARLAAELIEVRRRNNFSVMVDAALARAPRERGV